MGSFLTSDGTCSALKQQLWIGRRPETVSNPMRRATGAVVRCAQPGSEEGCATSVFGVYGLRGRGIAVFGFGLRV